MDSTGIVTAILALILVVGTIVGYRKGLVRQVLELVGIIASFILALLLAGALAVFLEERTPVPYSPALVIAFILIFIGGTIGFHFLALMMQKIVRMSLLGWVDRFSGAALGLVTAMVISSLLISLVLELPVSRSVRRGIHASALSNFLMPVAPRIFNLIIAHGPKRVHYDGIFKEKNTI
jgi:membrane protein required for colicin V production